MTDPIIDQPPVEQTEDSAQVIPLYRSQGDSETFIGTPLQRKTAELVKILATRETGSTYSDAAVTTLKLLKAFAAWLFQLSLTMFALAVWLWGLGFKGGYRFRAWIEEQAPSSEEIVCAVFRAMAFPFVVLYKWASAFGWSSLGLKDPLNAIATESGASQTSATSSGAALGSEPAANESGGDEKTAA